MKKIETIEQAYEAVDTMTTYIEQIAPALGMSIYNLESGISDCERHEIAAELSCIMFTAQNACEIAYKLHGYLDLKVDEQHSMKQLD